MASLHSFASCCCYFLNSIFFPLRTFPKCCPSVSSFLLYSHHIFPEFGHFCIIMSLLSSRWPLYLGGCSPSKFMAKHCSQIPSSLGKKLQKDVQKNVGRVCFLPFVLHNLCVDGVIIFVVLFFISFITEWFSFSSTRHSFSVCPSPGWHSFLAQLHKASPPRASTTTECLLKVRLVCRELLLALRPPFHWTHYGSVGGENDILFPHGHWPGRGPTSSFFFFLLLLHKEHLTLSRREFFLRHFLRSVKPGLRPLRS